MLRLLRQMRGLPIFAQQLGETVGTVEDWVIDPDKGQVVAYRVRGSGKQRWLTTVDVRHYLDDAVVIADQNVLQESAELVRLKPLLEKPLKLFGLKVVTEDGKPLGKLKDAAIETSGHFLAKLHVEPSIWDRFMREELILSREHIIRMDRREIVVRYDQKAPAADAKPEVIQ